MLGSVIVKKGYDIKRFFCVEVVKTQRDDIRVLEEFAARLEPRLRREFLAAIQRMKDQLNLDQLANLIQHGHIEEAANLLDGVSGFRSFVNAVSDGVFAAAQTVLANSAPLRQVDVVFGVTNPQTNEFLRNYEMTLTRDLTRQQQASVKAVIADGVKTGDNPLTIAQDVKSYIGLTERQTNAVLNYRNMLEQGDSDVLTRALRDKRFDKSVIRALEGDNPLSPDQIDRMVERYQEKYLKYRAETISRTEAIRAANKGNQLLWEEAVTDGKVDEDQIVREWIYTHDAKTRDAHLAIPEMNPDGVGLNEPFQSPLGEIMYPGDENADAANVINCRCTLFIRFVPRVEPEPVDADKAGYSPEQARDERGRWTLSGQLGDGRKVAFQMDRQSQAIGGYQLVHVDVAAVEARWATDKGFHVGRGGHGETSSPFKYERATKFVQSGARVNASIIGVSEDGRVGFTDGRHRFASMRDLGASSVPVTMDAESIVNAKKFGMIK